MTVLVVLEAQMLAEHQLLVLGYVLEAVEVLLFPTQL
jgi:hypothetical protein